MSEEMKMQELELERTTKPDAETVDAADVVAAARRKKEQEEEQRQHERELDFAERRARQQKKKRAMVRAVGGAAAFVLAALAVLGGMCWELVSPVFAIPLSIIWFMRAAVRYDRYARRWK